jgi:hypothetical protein
MDGPKSLEPKAAPVDFLVENIAARHYAPGDTLGTGDLTGAPLPVFELIADLCRLIPAWMRAMSERLEAWVHFLRTAST